MSALCDTRRVEDPGPVASAAPERQVVLVIAVVMVVAQLGWRAWALFPSWFYADDYRLMVDSRTSDFGWSYLLEPYDNQFMPIGRALVATVDAGGASWTVAAALLLALQALADVACVWMLLTAFGARWRILLPLGLYLSVAITLAGGMWWAAALNQLPLHLALFGSVASWIGYLRTRRRRWLLLTLAFLTLGLCGYVKTAFVFVVLAYLTLAYFSSGGPVRRVTSAVRRYLAALVSVGVLGVTFALYFTSQVPSLYQPPSAAVAGRLADTMIGTSLASGLVGGPWRWDDINPPVVGADPPPWAVHLSWVVIAVLILGLALRRTRTGRAWLLLSGYAAMSFVVLFTTRAIQVGEIAGLQYRYLTDVVPVAALCLGLATMELRGAVESSTPRADPLLTVVPHSRWLVAAAVVVLGSGLVSSLRYVQVWHDNNPGDIYTHTVIDGLRGRGPVDLADQQVPERVVPAFLAPANSTSHLLPLLVGNARFPQSTSHLAVLDDNGTPHQALISAAAVSKSGPVENCGWPLGEGLVTIPLETTTSAGPAWLRIGYLASVADELTVTINGAARDVRRPARRQQRVPAGDRLDRICHAERAERRERHVHRHRGGGSTGPRRRPVSAGSRADDLGETLVPPPPETAGTFPLLDTLRAVGALCVLTTHAAFWAGDYTRHGTVGTVLARLDVGVAIFFVLSGFLLSRGWLERAAAGRPAPAVRPYFWNRLLRIFPIYIVTAVLALVFIVRNRDLGMGQWVSTLSLTDPYFRDSFPAGLTHMWSLAVEVAFYVVLPVLMAVLVGRRRTLRPSRVGAGLLAMVAVSVWWHLDGAGRLAGQGRPLEWLPAFLTWFAAGILLALVEVRARHGISGRLGSALASLARQPGSCWTIVVGLMLISATPLAGPSMLAAPTEVESLTKHFIYACVGLLIVMTGVFNDPTSRYSRVMGHPSGRRVGWISYGIFCLHLPILHFVMWSTGWDLFVGRGVAIWALALGLSLVAAEIGYRVVERPALRLKRRGNSADPVAAAISAPTSGTSMR